MRSEFAVTARADAEQLADFDRKLGAAAREVCPSFGIDPAECIRDAAQATCYGKFAIHNNYFNTPGDGDRGHNLVVRGMPTGKVDRGGVVPIFASLAKYSSPKAAVLDYCRRRVGA